MQVSPRVAYPSVAYRVEPNRRKPSQEIPMPSIRSEDAPRHKRQRPLLRPLAALLAVALGSAHVLAQSASPGMVTLPDSVRQVDVAPPSGPIDPTRPLITRKTLKAAETSATIRIEVALKMRNFIDLQARISRGDQVTSAEMASRYEPLASDYDKVASWLATDGLTITRRDSHHMAIFAEGPVSLVQKALRVTFARVSLQGTEYTSAITAPSVPAAIAPLLVGINGMQPHIRPHRHILMPKAASTSGGASYLPRQIATAYHVASLYSSGIDGTGQTIAIVIDTFPASSDLEAFWKLAGVSQSISNIQFIQAVKGQLPQPSGEETLDTEWSSSMAPGAHVRVYAATDLETSDLDATYQQVYDDVKNHPGLNIHQMTMSYGFGEAYTTSSQVQTDDQYFAELATAGVTVFASSGDDGSTPGPNGTGDLRGPVQTESPADDPNVTAVGGTTLVLDNNNNVSSESVWNENGGASGGGISTYFSKPAWQTGTGVVSGTKREVPDVAAAADPQFGAVIVQGGEQSTVGGTSWSSPMWSGFCALINQARASAGQSSIGLLGPHIYPLLSSPNYPTNYLANFSDITSGNNATRRSNGDFAATAGYDLCTGLGSPLMLPLAQFLSGNTALVGVQEPAAVDEIQPGQNASFTVVVSGTTATYQWQRMPIGATSWTNLSDDSTYGGSTGPTLTISNATTAMSGDQFQCLVNLGKSITTTKPASTLVVETPLAITTLAGQVGVTGLANGSKTAAQFNYPSGIAVDGSGNAYVADFGNNQIRQITPTGQVSTPFGNAAGSPGSANGTGNSATFNSPNSVAIDGSNNLYVADSLNNVIRKISGSSVTTLAGGTGLNSPEGVAVDAAGVVYVADTGNNVIRKITPGGSSTVLAGQVGVAGYSDGAATSVAQFNNPVGIAVDGNGNVYVADMNNSVVRKISGGQVSTVAGQQGDSGYLDGLGANALFNAPIGVAVDGSNNVYIADSQVPIIGSTAAGNDSVRKLSSTGVVSTLAGQPGASGSINATGTSAQFYSVQGVAVGGNGTVYLADTYNQLIRIGTSNSTVATTKVISLVGNLAFGGVTVNSTGTNTLTIFNTGNTALTVTGISFPSGYSGDWQSGAVPAGQSQLVNVTFAPTTVQDYGGNIVVTSDATAGSNTIAVSGSGVDMITAPTFTTTSATDVTGTSAMAGASVNPNGSETTVYFEYGLTGTYGSITSGTSAGVGVTPVSITETIPSLLPSTQYHYQAVATSGTGTYFGGDMTFTTLAFSTSQLAARGDSAAGVPGATYSLLGNPAINASDYVAFQALLTNGLGSVTNSDNSGIWAQNSSGSRTLIARTGGIAPGTTNAKFARLGNPVYNAGESVAFEATLHVQSGRATPSSATGIWSNTGGLLDLIARTGSQAPGYPSGAIFTRFDGIALPDQGGVLLLATVSTGGHGIWQGTTSANLRLLAHEGATVNGRTISRLSFLPTAPYIQSQTRSFTQSGSAFVYGATFTGNTSGIVQLAGTTSTLVAVTGSAAPGPLTGEYSAFGSPVINANGYIAFHATLKTAAAITRSNNSGIWADDPTGALQLVTFTSANAPGTNATFATLGDPVYNNNEAVAFLATLNIASGAATPATNTGIWSNSGGSLVLVAQTGTQAPDCPTGVTFRKFNAFALPDQGGVVLLATLNTNRAASISAANRTGIWAVDTTGNLRLIVKTGDSVNGKKVAALSFLPVLTYVSGQTRNINQSTGDITYQATFTDHTTAIIEVAFP